MIDELFHLYRNPHYLKRLNEQKAGLKWKF